MLRYRIRRQSTGSISQFDFDPRRGDRSATASVEATAKVEPGPYYLHPQIHISTPTHVYIDTYTYIKIGTYRYISTIIPFISQSLRRPQHYPTPTFTLTKPKLTFTLY